MSRLAMAIDYQKTGNISALSKLAYNYTDISFSHHKSGYAYEFKIEVKLSTKKWLDESTLISTNENDPAIRQEVYSSIKRAMIEEIFGEFRPIIIELQSAIYDKNQDRMRQLTAELEHKMFFEGVYR
jgi:hypothetical protein